MTIVSRFFCAYCFGNRPSRNSTTTSVMLTPSFAQPAFTRLCRSAGIRQFRRTVSTDCFTSRSAEGAALVVFFAMCVLLDEYELIRVDEYILNRNHSLGRQVRA